LTGGVDGDRGLERRQLLETLPAVIEGDASERLVAAGGVRLRATAAAASAFDRHLAVSPRIEGDRGRAPPPVLRAGPRSPAGAKPAAGAGGLGQEDAGAGGRLTAAYERAIE